MPTRDDIDACVFDAYGTLFDVTAAAQHCQDALGERWGTLAQVWRDKQLQYTWLRSLMDEYIPFWQVTSDALDYALATLGIDDADLRKRLSISITNSTPTLRSAECSKSSKVPA